MTLMEGVVYTGASSTGVVHTRLLTKIDGIWADWEPVGYKPTQNFRRMRLSSFRTWILNYEKSKAAREKLLPKGEWK